MSQKIVKHVGVALYAAVVRGVLLSQQRHKKTTITYKELQDTLTKVDHQCQLSEALAYITEEDHENRRPLLASLVVSSATHWPGAGYFNQCSELGYRVLEDMDFWPKQLTKLYCTVDPMYLDTFRYNKESYTEMVVSGMRGKWKVVSDDGLKVTLNDYRDLVTDEADRSHTTSAPTSHWVRQAVARIAPPKWYTGPVSKYRPEMQPPPGWVDPSSVPPEESTSEDGPKWEEDFLVKMKAHFANKAMPKWSPEELAIAAKAIADHNKVASAASVGKSSTLKGQALQDANQAYEALQPSFAEALASEEIPLEASVAELDEEDLGPDDSAILEAIWNSSEDVKDAKIAAAATFK